MKNIKTTRKFNKAIISRYLNLLEANEMNISKTAKEIGIDRGTLFRWKSKYWNTYLNEKNEVKEQMQDITAVKLYTVKEFDNLKEIFTKGLKLTLSKIIDILSDEEALKKLKPSDLAEFIKVMAPYAAEKIGLAGTNPSQTPLQQHNTFVQNIIEQMNVNKLKDIEDAAKQNQV